MNLESPKVKVQKPAQYIFDALSDVKNFATLMPDNCKV
jgi:carbon monoxide dehydrogenase subunit G